MIETVRKEEISRSYLNAVCAIKGISMENQEHDDDGLDVILKKIITLGNGSRFNALMSVQLKSTSSDYSEYPDYYSYPLKKKNYDDLLRPATVKSFLFLLILPENENDWLAQSIEQLIIRKCMFWIDMEGFPNRENTSSVTVKIPKANVVTPEALVAILEGIAEDVVQ